jgi:hypothetical protein
VRAGVYEDLRYARRDEVPHEIDRFTDFDARPPEG